MAWAKLDDTFWMHPKVMAVGNVGAGVFARMLSYCGAYLTDGLVPGQIVQMLLGPEGPEKAEELLDAFERLRLVDRMESGAVAIVNYTEYNPSKAKVEADRETRRSNGRKGGRPRSSDT